MSERHIKVLGVHQMRHLIFCVDSDWLHIFRHTSFYLQHQYLFSRKPKIADFATRSPEVVHVHLVRSRTSDPWSFIIALSFGIGCREIVGSCAWSWWEWLVAILIVKTAWATWFVILGQCKSMWIHSVFNALWACVSQTVIIADCLKHVQPDSALLALKMPRFQFDPIQRSYRAAGCCQFRTKSEHLTLAPCLANLMWGSSSHPWPLFDIVTLCMLDLI